MTMGCLFTSCIKSEAPLENVCELEIRLEPFCSFNPKLSPTTPFPVRPLAENLNLSNEDYFFSWSHDLDFGGSAISVTFEQLPITLQLTEKSSGCVAEATLDNTYWD